VGKMIIIQLWNSHRGQSSLIAIHDEGWLIMALELPNAGWLIMVIQEKPYPRITLVVVWVWISLLHAGWLIMVIQEKPYPRITLVVVWVWISLLPDDSEPWAINLFPYIPWNRTLSQTKEILIHTIELKRKSSTILIYNSYL